VIICSPHLHGICRLVGALTSSLTGRATSHADRSADRISTQSPRVSVSTCRRCFSRSASKWVDIGGEILWHPSLRKYAGSFAASTTDVVAGAVVDFILVFLRWSFNVDAQEKANSTGDAADDSTSYMRKLATGVKVTGLRWSGLFRPIEHSPCFAHRRAARLSRIRFDAGLSGNSGFPA